MKRAWIRGWALGLALLMAVAFGLTGCKKASVEEPQEELPTLEGYDYEGTAELVDSGHTPNATATAEGRATLLHFRDSAGYVVPVMCHIPWEEGIAKAALEEMVETAAPAEGRGGKLGLKAPIPNGTTIELNVKDGLATVNLGKAALQCKDLAQEQAMVTSIVNTLVEFPAIEKVQFWVDGKQLKTLSQGTNIEGAFTRQSLNPDSTAASLGLEGADVVTVYFEGDGGDYLVPVSRLVPGPAELEDALSEWARGPSSGAALASSLPAGCTLNEVAVSGSLATIDFSAPFAALAEDHAAEKAVMKELLLVCQCFSEVDSVVLTVDGVEYLPGNPSNLAAPTFANIE